jgi:hypothetical protein
MHPIISFFFFVFPSHDSSVDSHWKSAKKEKKKKERKKAVFR